jgi:hypothetical protein
VQLGQETKLRLPIWSLLALICFAPAARADVAVLLEEPYSYDGALAGTGHTAIYLNHVCAASPTVLRRCFEGESGVVISRYHRIAGYDWLAIPLYPYLYAVDRPADIPLFADSKLEAALRDRYRRKHLNEIAPDLPDGTIPGGDWYELIGSAYDRTLYGLQIETTAEQDDKFIAAYNAGPNRAAYKLVTRNCADFVREAVNFYYPKSTGRSVLADLDVSTPKHVARSLARYSQKHPDLQFTKFVIPQVPGTIRRSRPVHGLVDSVFTAKKYVVPLALLHPFVAGGVGVAYLTSGQFNPAKNAVVLTQSGELERPLTNQERQAYEKGLAEVTATRANKKPASEETSWDHLLANAKLGVDDKGRPVLQVRTPGTAVTLGITRDNVLDSDAPAEIVQQLLVARLREQLKRGRSPKTSEAELRRDWKMLKIAFASSSDMTTQAELRTDDTSPGLE